MAQIAIVFGMLVCLALGWVVGDWQRSGDVIASMAAASERQGKAWAAQVVAERRFAELASAQSAQRVEFRDRVASAPELSDCPVPDSVGLLLDAQAARSRAAASLPGGRVPGPAAVGKPDARKPAGAQLH